MRSNQISFFGYQINKKDAGGFGGKLPRALMGAILSLPLEQVACGSILQSMQLFRVVEQLFT